MSTRFLRLSLLLAPLLLTTALAGCGEALPNLRSAADVQQAVQQQYDADSVNVVLRQGEGIRRLEVVLTNPGGREATNHEAARTVAQTAQAQYDNGPMGAVRVSFEYSSEAGPAEVGFHRRYTFSTGDLQAAASDTSASRADTSARSSPADTSAPQP